MIEKLPPEKRALVERLIEALGEPPPPAAATNAEDLGILKWAGRFHLGGPIGSLTVEELHDDG
jgi:hypothetical protein